MRSLHEILNYQYYKKSSWILFLLPLSYIYFLIIFLRSWFYKIGIFEMIKMDVPVVVIGNINIGGTGKTPLAIWLLEKLIKKGMKPGLICSGYNSDANLPQEVFSTSEVKNVGDEALMIKQRMNIPLFVGKKKAQVGMALLNSYPDINILISDDGLQHHELERDFEIVIVDEERQFGNGHLVPAGPLRERISRIKKVDALVINSWYKKKPLPKSTIVSHYRMTCYGNVLENCFQNERKSSLERIMSKKEIVAVTGIGNPEKFFWKLTVAGIQFHEKTFNDHHLFTKSDFKDYDDMNIIMTEKDAVKCKHFAKENFWSLPIYADVDEELFKKLTKKLGI